MSAPPTGHYWGRCDSCGKATARPYRTVWVACWRASCHPPIDRRTPTVTDSPDLHDLLTLRTRQVSGKTAAPLLTATNRTENPA